METPIKICVASGIFPPDTGGPAKFAETFLGWGAKIGAKIDCVSLTDDSTQTINVRNSQIDLISRRQFLFLRYLATVKALVNKMNDGFVVLANGLFLETWLAHLLTRKPYVCKVPGDIVWERATNRKLTEADVSEFQSESTPWKYRLFRFLFTKSLQGASVVITPSIQLQDLCVQWGVRSERIHLIHNSIDTDKFSPHSQRKKYDVVVVNRLVPWKHVDEVIVACQDQSLSLLIIGDGPERQNLEEISKPLGNVFFVGQKTQDEIPKLMNEARCFVLNSSFEATSYSLLEARSMGLFCIANAGTGSEEVVTHMVDGVLCGKTGISLSEALRIFKFDKSFVSQASKLARQNTQARFNMHLNYNAIYKLIGDL